MAIDADLNAGALTTEEAKQRREEISRGLTFTDQWMVRLNLLKEML